MAADLENFKHLYLFSLTSYGLITGLADFSFTEQCYWYLQSTLNTCLKAAPLLIEKPDFPDFLQILFLSTVTGCCTCVYYYYVLLLNHVTHTCWTL